MRDVQHTVELCIVGGGLPGMCAAIAAARMGTKVALMHDRPVLGGNASSEIRMWIWGAIGDNNRETGIIEEIQLENLYRNPLGNWSIWDSILYEKVRFEPNITLLLNCSCNQIQMADSRIEAIKGWQLTTETWHTVRANLFADCSGDSILAPLSGAEFRMGREAKDEFGEDIAPQRADKKTMGMSCLLQVRQTDRPQQFISPSWANTYPTDDDLPNRPHDITEWNTNFWWIEVGGEDNCIDDTESLRDELLKISFGVWDHIKNRGDHGAENWALDWVGFLPGKRESRRYVGDHILTQNDIRGEREFDDLVAYGGWPMDDHHPAGIRYAHEPNTFHPAPSPFGIPYRCLYSRNIDNLFCAGRNISTSHTALSSTRVMATCAILGQAVGTAAAIAASDTMLPRQVGREQIGQLQQALLEADCYLPGFQRKISKLAGQAKLRASSGDPSALRNGWDRPGGEEQNSWSGPVGSWLAYSFSGQRYVSDIRIIFDSDLNRSAMNLPCSYPLNPALRSVPACMTKAFSIELQDDKGDWNTVFQTNDNHHRLVHVPIDARTSGVRLVPQATWGDSDATLFAFDVQ